LLKSIGAVCADWDCAVTGNCDEEFILLVDYTIINQEEGKPQYQAVLTANMSRRPILMTSLATVAGTAAGAGIGAGAEVQPDGDCDYGWLQLHAFDVRLLCQCFSRGIPAPVMELMQHGGQKARHVVVDGCDPVSEESLPFHLRSRNQISHPQIVV